MRRVDREAAAGSPTLRQLPGLNDGTNVISKAFAQAQQRYNESGALPYHLRSRKQIAGFFDGLELVEPGLVSVPRWRPDSAAGGDLPAEVDAFGGVGRKP